MDSGDPTITPDFQVPVDSQEARWSRAVFVWSGESPRRRRGHIMLGSTTRGDDMKAAIILFADTDRPEGMGRMANALTSASEFKEAGDEIVVIFDGAGVKWVPELADEGHKYHALLEEVRDVVAGACVYCSRAYGVKEQVEAAQVAFLDEFRGHPSIRSLVADGHQVLTF
jgi:hypothetical protein